jgi:hypothetical protein
VSAAPNARGRERDIVDDDAHRGFDTPEDKPRMEIDDAASPAMSLVRIEPRDAGVVVLEAHLARRGENLTVMAVTGTGPRAGFSRFFWAVTTISSSFSSACAANGQQ